MLKLIKTIGRCVRLCGLPPKVVRNGSKFVIKKGGQYYDTSDRQWWRSIYSQFETKEAAQVVLDKL